MRYSVCEATRIVVEVKRISHTTRRNLTHDAVILVYDDRNASRLRCPSIEYEGLDDCCLARKEEYCSPL
jgi:hypothetical protein